MHTVRKTRPAIVAGLLLFAVREASTQAATAAPASSDSVVLAPGPQYRAGSLHRSLFGSGWRDVWTTSTPVPVLHPETHLGGLTLLRRGGGFHSIVTHWREEHGWRRYLFRSVDKFPMQGAPDEVKGTLVGRVMEDQVSILFPAAPLVVPPLLEAIGALHVDVDLYVMADSPRLEHLRDTVAGMLGTFELNGQEAPGDEPGFAGSRKVKGTFNFLDDLVSGQDHRLDEREFLAVRLIDILVNDPDRSPDNFDWARFGERGAYTWRPVARDRDQAFMDARGIVNSLVIRRIYAKQVSFGNEPQLRGLTYSTHFLDRKLLQRLDAGDVREVALRVQRAITDSVIDAALDRLPRSWHDSTTADETIAAVMRYRRDRLPDIALAFYRDLARLVDVRGTKDADRFDVLRHPDGRVTVTITDGEAAPLVAATRRSDGAVETVSGGALAASGSDQPYFSRTFVPGETDEIRLYAFGGDDIVTVRGAPTSQITVRVIGGKGDDVMVDSAGGGATALYDSEGKNRFAGSDDTHVSEREWKEIQYSTGFRAGGDWKPDFGASRGWRPNARYNTGAGLVVGVGPRFKQYGFRRLPYHWQVGANFMVGTGNGRVGANVDADYRMENSPLALTLQARASQLESTRFFGYGNNTTQGVQSLVDQNEIMVQPSVVWHVGYRAREGFGNPVRGEDTVTVAGLRPLVGELRIGPVAGWIDPQPHPASPLALSGARGSVDLTLLGAQFGLELDRTDRSPIPSRGWRVDAGVAGFPSLAGLGNGFGTASAHGALYLPLASRDGPVVAMRLGGAVAAGDYPVQFAPAIGGRGTVRGYTYRRFAGDAAANGGVELRVPVGTVNFLIKSQLGVFGLADAGRVWHEGASAGGWHTGLGGGVWLASLGRSISVAYARGERDRLYLSTGLAY